MISAQRWNYSQSSLIRPTHFPMLLLRHILRSLGGTKTLQLIHARSIVSIHCSRDDILETNALIDHYSKCAAMGSAHHVFDQMHKPNITLWRDLMSGHFENRFALEALRLFKSMVSEHHDPCSPNEYISTLVLTCCNKVGYVLLGRQCHGYLLKSGLVFHQYVKSALIHLYCMLSDMVGAVDVLVSVPQEDNCPYNMDMIMNMIVVGPGEKDYLDEALIILRRMLAEDMVWNKATYIGMFGLCARILDLELGRQVHNKLLKSDVEFDESVSNAVINMYGKFGAVTTALNLFYMLKARNTVSWTTTMSVLSRWGLLEESLILFHYMQLDDVVPNESTFSVLLYVSAVLFSQSCGNSYHALAEKTGFKGHKDVDDALINMYLRTGDIKAAKKVFLGMSYRDVVTWNMMIRGYRLHGFPNESLALFQEMLKLGEDTNHHTFVGVLDACGDLRLVGKGFDYFYRFMKQKGFEPHLDHYRCLINILVKARRVEEAFDFMLETPIKWDDKSWGTLLQGCLDRKNFDLYSVVAKTIPNDENISTWLQCTNIFLDDDRVVEPALSWFEIKSQVYTVKSVVKGDPRFVKHHKMMKSLFSSIKADANMPDTDNVLHDEVDDEIKEDCDGYHSEKLAVAIALLKTHKAQPICIILKSGKICDDCHSFMKLVSKAKNRLITVRDSKSFHHFQDGSCSCADADYRRYMGPICMQALEAPRR